MPQARMPGIGPNPYIGRMQGAELQQEQGAAAETEAMKARNRQGAEILRDEMTNTAGVDAHRQAMDTAYQQTRQAELDKFKSLTQQYADTKIDPHQFWASRTTGDKISASIGLALGALGPGGVNHSVEVLNTAINRDIEAQKANLEVKGRAATNQTNLLGIMKGNYETDSTALSATRVTMKENALLQIDQMMARTADPVAAAKLKQMKGKLQQDMLGEVSKADLSWKEAASNAAFRAATLNRMGVGQGNEDAAIHAAASNWIDAASQPSSAVPFIQTGAKARMAGAEGAMTNIMGWRANEQSLARVRAMLPGLITRFGGDKQKATDELVNILKTAHYGKAPAGKETMAEGFSGE